MGVTAREWSLTLSRPDVPAGVARIGFLNRGEDPHDLRLRSAGGATLLSFDEAPPDGYEERDVSLGAGSYTLFCSLPGHEALGMRATLVVR